jgi:lipoprotein-anchoring transpeptidase ErfK/SrfK
MGTLRFPLNHGACQAKIVNASRVGMKPSVASQKRLQFKRAPKKAARRAQLAFAGLALVMVLGIWWLYRSPASSSHSSSHPIVAIAKASTAVNHSSTNLSATPSAPPEKTSAPTISKPETLSVARPALAESNGGTNDSATNQVPSPNDFPRAALDLFEAQIAMARKGISSGSIDGLMGPQTRSALRAFQHKENLAVTGELDAATKAQLSLNSPTCFTYLVTSNDLSRLQPVSKTWLGKSKQTALDYETILELLAEKGHAHPNFVKRLNPNIDWSGVKVGTSIQLPDVRGAEVTAKAAFINVNLTDKILEAFDAGTNLLAHFPCSIAQRVEKRPVGELHVAIVAPNPNYTLDPAVFPESPEAQQLKTKLVLPPGPNNPVGVAWIGLDKPGYGIHGTPSPEQVGRTESHGCFRLANWNADYLLRLVSIGTPVNVQP